MRNRFTTLAALLPVILILSAGIANAQGDKDKFKARYESNAVNKEFDPHDFTGIWEMTRLDHTLGTKPPPLTRAGIEAMKGRIGDTPGVPRPVADAARASTEVQLAGNGIRSNAPWLECNPMGFPRLMNDDEPMEFISFEDTTAIYETTFFPRVYERFCRMLTTARPYVLRGRIEEDFGALAMTVEEIEFLDGALSPGAGVASPRPAARTGPSSPPGGGRPARSPGRPVRPA